LKHVNVTQWVRGNSSPTRPTASHQVGSRTEVRPLKGGVRSRGKTRTQAASLNSEKCIMVDSRISPGDRIEIRPYAGSGRQQSRERYGKRTGHHRGLRAGHVGTGVIRELGRASRLLGSKSRSRGDRPNQHPGVGWSTWPAGEPTLAQARRDTNHSTSHQGTGREHKAHRPGWTKAVVATHSTAGQGKDACPEAWGTEAQGTHDKTQRSAGRQCRAWRRCRGKARGTLSPKLPRRNWQRMPQGSSSHVAWWSSQLPGSWSGWTITDEPYDRIGHVRVCGGGGSDPTSYPALDCSMRITPQFDRHLLASSEAGR
jgi:hypothetical protein